MSKAKKIGIILILIGIFLPIVFLPFTSGYYPKSDFIWNIQKMEIILRQEQGVKQLKGIKFTPDKIHIFEYLGTDPSSKAKSLLVKVEGIDEVIEFPPETPKEVIYKTIKRDFFSYKPKISIQYRYIFTLGVVLVFIGIGFIVLSKNKKGFIDK